METLAFVCLAGTCMAGCGICGGLFQSSIMSDQQHQQQTAESTERGQEPVYTDTKGQTLKKLRFKIRFQYVMLHISSRAPINAMHMLINVFICVI